MKLTFYTPQNYVRIYLYILFDQRKYLNITLTTDFSLILYESKTDFDFSYSLQIQYGILTVFILRISQNILTI